MGEERYEHVRFGVTGRLDSLQAAVLLAKLDIFETELARRQRVAVEYTALIAQFVPTLVTPRIPDGYTSAWAQYCLLAQDSAHREQLRENLYAAGIPTGVYYPIPLHLQKVYTNLGYQRGSMPVSEDLSQRMFALPMHPHLTTDMVRTIVSHMNR
jgi:dTDP-4-amino-4,6-dideoxygalactose transaminase